VNSALSLDCDMLFQVGAPDIVIKIVDDLKDEQEQYRKMVMETIEKVSDSAR
jgi:hypothetical protein